MPEEFMTATADGEQLDLQVTEQVEQTGDTGQVTAEQQMGTQDQAGRTFTQAQLDEIVQRRIAKEQARFENERTSTAQQARDSWIADQGYEWKGKPIKTEAEYKEALKEAELEQEISRKYAHLPDEVQMEMLENRKFREQYQAKEQEFAEQQRTAQEQSEFETRKNSMYAEFLSEFPDHNTEEAWGKIPADVWSDAEKWLQTGGREGRRLADGLTRHNWKQGQAQQQAETANQANAASSTGSVKAQAPPKGPLTQEMVEKMSDKERMSRWPEIRKLYGMK